MGNTSLYRKIATMVYLNKITNAKELIKELSTDQKNEAIGHYEFLNETFPSEHYTKAIELIQITL